MRRSVLAGVLVLLGAFLLPAPAAAQPGAGRIDAAVSGPYTGTQTFEFGTAGCSFVHQVFEGTYQAQRGGTGRFRIDACVSAGTPFTFTGSFVLRPPTSGSLTGSVIGTTDAALPKSSLELTLTVERATKPFRGVTGSIGLSGVWSNEPPGTLGAGPTSGVLVGDLLPRGG